MYLFFFSNNYCRNYFVNFGFIEFVCYMVFGIYYVEFCGVLKCGINSYILIFFLILKFVKFKKMFNMCLNLEINVVVWYVMGLDFKIFYLILILFIDFVGKK